eukprot:SAG31_NODE_3624_length_4058_cov_2.587270_1_plen_226_part_00
MTHCFVVNVGLGFELHRAEFAYEDPELRTTVSLKIDGKPQKDWRFGTLVFLFGFVTDGSITCFVFVVPDMTTLEEGHIGCIARGPPDQSCATFKQTMPCYRGRRSGISTITEEKCESRKCFVFDDHCSFGAGVSASELAEGLALTEPDFVSVTIGQLMPTDGGRREQYWAIVQPDAPVPPVADVLCGNGSVALEPAPALQVPLACSPAKKSTLELGGSRAQRVIQ